MADESRSYITRKNAFLIPASIALMALLGSTVYFYTHTPDHRAAVTLKDPSDTYAGAQGSQ